jgi:hypothetical protein
VKFQLAADLGTEQDHSAFSVFESIPSDRFIRSLSDVHLGLKGKHEVDWIAHLRYLERVPLQTPYPDVLERLKLLLSTPPLAGNTTLIVDATGCGIPIVQWMRREGLHPVPIVITGGRSVTEETSGAFGVPKRDLAMSLQALFGTRRLKIAPRLGFDNTGGGEDYTKILLDEIRNFKVKITERKNDTYEAWREKDHDDMVLSVAMNAWYFQREHPYKRIFEDEEKEKPYNPKEWL